MSKKIIPSCDCDITKRMIAEGIICIEPSEEKPVPVIIASQNPEYSKLWLNDGCPKCGQPLEIEEEFKDGFWEAESLKSMDYLSRIQSKENPQPAWEDLPEDISYYEKTACTEVTLKSIFAQAINRIGRKVFGEK